MVDDAVMRTVRNVFFACKDFTSAHFDDGVGALPNLRAAIAAFEAASGGGWRPIETAPRNGTPIVAIIRVFNTKTRAFSHWDRHIIWFNEESGEIDADDYTGWRWDDYEFWHSLLPFPKIPNPDSALPPPPKDPAT